MKKRSYLVLVLVFAMLLAFAAPAMAKVVDPIALATVSTANFESDITALGLKLMYIKNIPANVPAPLFCAGQSVLVLDDGKGTGVIVYAFKIVLGVDGTLKYQLSTGYPMLRSSVTDLKPVIGGSVPLGAPEEPEEPEIT